jgi:hypothetical protein
VVLVAEDVGEHGEALLLENEPHGDAGGRSLERHAGVHQGEREPHTVAIEDEPFDSVISDTHRMV